MSDALPAVYKLSARIERLEAELERANDQLHETLGLYEHVRDDLADWHRHGVKVTVDCETCDGDGLCHHPECDGHGNWRYQDIDRKWHEDQCPKCSSAGCPDCGGTGKKPRDGVEPLARNATYFWHDSTKRDGYFIPAEWLDAE